ncbi:hypothetical protein OQA88_11471 [Cercophora sp. LCS_1]
MATPKIAIIGAGPAGCMLARLLHQSSIPVTIFESEASPNYRSQGGTLDLHTSTGLAALKEANLFEQFLSHARYDGDHLQITDQDFKVHLEVVGSPAPVDQPSSHTRQQRPEIDRSDLRRILTESLPPDMIHWDHHLVSFNPDTRTLVFKNGTTHSNYDLVVGADGAWSKIRTAIAPVTGKPIPAGVGMFELTIPRAKETVPELSTAIKGGNVFAHQEFRRLCVQQMGDGSLSVYAIKKEDDPGWVDKLDFDVGDLDAVKRHLLGGENAPFGKWHPLLRMAIEKAEGKATPRTFYQLPVGFEWEHREGVTLIGDAAHLMTPFAGEGVNVALEDAMRLARAVSGGDKDGLDGRVKELEREMWRRAERVARLTDQLTRLWMFETGTPGSVIVRTSALHVNFDTPAIFHPFTSLLLRGYLFYKGLVGW